jgi:hypothetical protein
MLDTGGTELMAYGEPRLSAPDHDHVDALHGARSLRAREARSTLGVRFEVRGHPEASSTSDRQDRPGSASATNRASDRQHDGRMVFKLRRMRAADQPPGAERGRVGMTATQRPSRPG